MDRDTYIPHYYFFATRPHPKNADITCGIGLPTKEHSGFVCFMYEEHMGESKMYTSPFDTDMSFSSQSIVLMLELVETTERELIPSSRLQDPSNMGPCWVCDTANVSTYYVVQNSATKNNGIRRICDECFTDVTEQIWSLTEQYSHIAVAHNI